MSDIIFETINRLRVLESQVLSEALTPEEEKQLADLMAKHKAKLDDGEYMTSMPKEIQNKASQIFALQKQSTGTTPATAGADPKVKAVQEKLIALGFQVGKTGADGKMGPATIGAIKSFESFAGVTPTGKITPEFEALLAKGQEIKTNNPIVKALTSLEALVKKYAKTPQTQSVDVSDIDAMTESELRSFILGNMKYLTLSEQMSAMSLMLTEAPLPSQLDAANARYPGASAGGLPTQSQAAMARYPGTTTTTTSTPAVTQGTKPGMLDRLKTFGKNVVGRMTGVRPGAAVPAGTAAVKTGAKAAGKMALRLVPGLGWGLLAFDIIGAISDTLKDSGIPDADKQIITQNLEILKKFTADKNAASSMPADIQKRITDVMKSVETLGAQPAAAAPAAPAAGAPGTDAVVAP